MHWIYILKNDSGYYYVGETKRLHRRLGEHLNLRGGKNTEILEINEIVATYPTWKIRSLIKSNGYGYRNNHEIENIIVESIMYNNNEYEKIRGGKYCRFDIDYKKPTRNIIIPFCNCDLPCDFNLKDKYYFRCPKKNMYENFKEIFEEKKSCNFHLEYKYKENFKIENEEKQIDKNDWLENIPTHNEKSGGETHFTAYCIGYKDYDSEEEEPEHMCHKYKKKDMKMYKGIRLCICNDCFINNYDEIKKRYYKKKCYFK